MYLLDTCVLLWIADSQEALSEKAIQIISQNPGNLFISAITGFEIAVKSEKKALILPLPPDEWLRKALKLHGIEEIPMTCDIGAKSAMLPKIHRDPCDRVIIATSLKHNMPILTKDTTMPQYPDVKIVW